MQYATAVRARTREASRSKWDLCYNGDTMLLVPRPRSIFGRTLIHLVRSSLSTTWPLAAIFRASRRLGMSTSLAPQQRIPMQCRLGIGGDFDSGIALQIAE